MNNIKNHSDLKDATTVFFSYSRVDQKQALPIISAIEKAGYRVWWDGMLEGGTSFLETTEEALESAKAVVVLWSKNSVKSHWVRDEAMSGRTRERLLPISLDGTIPPLGFRQVQIIDFTDWRQDSHSEGFKELQRGLALFHGKDETVAPPTALQKIRRPLSRRAILLGSGGVLFGSLAGLGIARQFNFSTKTLTNTLIVRPFENLLGPEDEAYIVKGLSSEIRSQLAQNTTLKVLAKSSSLAAAADNMNVKEMANILGVAYSLDGSVSKIGEKLKVSVELTEGNSGFSAWSEIYENKKDELIFVKDSITRSVLNELSKNVDDSAQPIQKGGTNNPAAFDAYLRGVTLYEVFESIASLELALSFLDTATKLDMNFGKALTVKAQLLLSLASYSPDINTVQNYKDRALATAEKAVRVVPDMAESHSALGFIRMGLLDISGAEDPYQRSYELDLGSSAVQARYAIFKMVMGEQAQALTAITKALGLDPLNETMHSTAGLIHYAAGRYEKSIDSYRRVLELAPSFFNARGQIGLSLIRLGQIEEGLSECAQEANVMERLTCQAIGYHKLGNSEDAQTAMTDLISRFGDSAAYQQVQILSEWGEDEAAIAMLKKAIALKDSGLTLTFFDPALDAIRQNEEFADLLAEIGFKL